MDLIRNDHILVWTNGGYRLYRAEPLAAGTFFWSAPNGHQTYLPGQDWIVTDTYPDAQRKPVQAAAASTPRWRCSTWRNCGSQRNDDPSVFQ